MIYLDTHVLVWLYAGRTDLIPPSARALIDASDLMISPITVLELQYLFESDKTREPAGPVVDALEREIGLRRCELPFADVVGAAIQESWTRDPFDRITVAHARLQGAPLLTKDRTMHAHYDATLWEGTSRGA